VPKSTIARVIQKQEELRDERTLHDGQQGISQKRKSEVRDPDVEEASVSAFTVVTRQVYVLVIQC
jgi:hypothetical protein